MKWILLALSTPLLGLPLIVSGDTSKRIHEPAAGEITVAAVGGLPACGCAVEDAHFRSEDGGCKDLSTGLVWSHMSFDPCFTTPPVPVQLTWQEACDYCDSLVEGGYDDWFLPSKEQMLELATNEGLDSSDAWHLTWTPDPFSHWSSSRRGNRRWLVNVTAETSGLDLPSSTRAFLCARVASTGNATSMHVESIALSKVGAGGGQKRGRARVTILDELGSPVNGAAVTGLFTGDFAECQIATTGSDGVATLTTDGSASGSISFMFCVEGVTGALTYDDGANVETCDTF